MKLALSTKTFTLATVASLALGSSAFAECIYGCGDTPTGRSIIASIYGAGFGDGVAVGLAEYGNHGSGGVETYSIKDGGLNLFAEINGSDDGCGVECGDVSALLHGNGFEHVMAGGIAAAAGPREAMSVIGNQVSAGINLHGMLGNFQVPMMDDHQSGD